MGTGPRLKVSYEKLEMQGVEPATPDLQGEWIHTIAAPHNEVLKFHEPAHFIPARIV